MALCCRTRTVASALARHEREACEGTARRAAARRGQPTGSLGSAGPAGSGCSRPHETSRSHKTSGARPLREPGGCASLRAMASSVLTCSLWAIAAVSVWGAIATSAPTEGCEEDATFDGSFVVPSGAPELRQHYSFVPRLASSRVRIGASGPSGSQLRVRLEFDSPEEQVSSGADAVGSGGVGGDASAPREAGASLAVAWDFVEGIEQAMFVDAVGGFSLIAELSGGQEANLTVGIVAKTVEDSCSGDFSIGIIRD